MQKLRWGIVGTGNIAFRMARALERSSTGTLAAVASRDIRAAEKFVAAFSGVTAVEGYDALFARPEIDAVYIATPHSDHAKWSIRAIRAGKAVLCEKPAAVTAVELRAVLDVARECRGFFLEAFMYRSHPQTAQLVELVRSGVIGRVHLIECAFAFAVDHEPGSRLFRNALGGGGILDVGCYCVSMARLLAGAALGQDFAEPLKVKGVGLLEPKEGIDLHASALLEFSGGITASLFTGLAQSHENAVRVWGSGGSIAVTQPWLAGTKGARILVAKKGEAVEEFVTESASDLYAYQIDLVARHRLEGQATAPSMTWEDSLGNARVLDWWRKEVEVVYEAQKYPLRTEPVWGAPLVRRPGHSLLRMTIPGLGKPMSRLAVGALTSSAVGSLIVFDDYFERGGNVFDTAFAYGGTDGLVGHWMQSRDVRGECVVVAKGGMPPNCTPEGLNRELFQSLEALKTGYIDIYVLHRDNPEVPVGEFVDLLHEHRSAGRIRVFGGSNWTIARIAEANAYAEKRGIAGFGLLNNQMSLARMVNPVWDGCVSAADEDSLRWLRENQFPLLAWSSQARGFFTERAAENKLADAEFVRSWYAPDNFERKRRAAELARRKGVEEINIALAYVLSQPSPVCCLIGPDNIAEVRSCFRALEVSLSLEELRWLNLESASIGG